ncbi:AAA family ATPase [Candidatus Omnitrophota bacterium]
MSVATFHIEFEPKDALEFLEHKFPETDNWWGQGILCPRSKAIISGPEGIGKSLIALNLAVSLASGLPYLGFEIPEKKKVLYLNFEISPRNLQKRLKRILEYRGLEAGELFLDTIFWFDINNNDSFERLREALGGGKYDVLIIDCMYKVHSGDENSEQETKRVLDRLDLLIQEFGISVVLIHHHNKGDRRGTQRMRGSTVIPAWVDTAINLSKKGKVIKMDFDKVRNGEQPESIIIAINDQLWLEVKGSAEKGKMVKLSTEEVIRITGKMPDRLIAVKSLAGKAKVSEATAFRAIKKAEAEKKLFLYNNRKPYAWSQPLGDLSRDHSFIRHVKDGNE